MEDYFDYIDDYMDGSLSSDNRIRFEKELEANPSLRLAINNYHDAKKLSEGLLELDMMGTLSRHKELSNQSSIQLGHSKKRRLLLGIILLISIGLASWWFRKQTLEKNKKQILATYIRPIDNNATKSLDTIGMDAFRKGKYYFSLNRFEESEVWLLLYLSEENDKKLISRGHFWLGAAHLEQWELSEAKKAWSQSGEKDAKENLKLIN